MEKRKNIQRGQVKDLILSALKSGDKYGYQIIKEIFDSTDGKLEIKQPTLYNSLKILEQEGLVSSYEGKETLGGKRKYFKLTKKGLNKLPAEEVKQEEVKEEVKAEPAVNIMLPKQEKVEPVKEESVEEENKQNEVIDMSKQASEPIETPKFKKYDDPMDRLRVEDDAEGDKQDALNVLYNPNETRMPTKEEKAKKENIPTFAPYPENNSYKIIEELNKRTISLSSEPKKEEKVRPVKLNQKNAENYKSILDKLVDTKVIHQEIVKPEDRIETDEPKLIAQSISIGDLQAKAQVQGYKLRYHEKRLGNNSSLIYKNKATLLTTLFLFLIGTIELIGYYLLFQEKLMLNNFAYVTLECIFAAMFVFALLKFIFNPKKKSRPTFKFKQAFLTTLLIAVNLMVVWVAVCLIFFNLNIQETSKILLQIVLPFIYVVLIPLYPVIYKGVSKMKIMYT